MSQVFSTIAVPLQTVVLFVCFCPCPPTDPPAVRDVSRDPGLPAREGAGPQGLEEGLLLPAALWAVLLHQGLVKGWPPLGIRFRFK